MVIRKVVLRNFRSHREFVLECDPQTTTIIGENGCGKTSVLEAIYEAMQGKSFRAVDAEIVKRGEDFYRVELEYEDGRRVVVAYDGTKKEFLAEDKKVRRLPKKSKYPIVLFEPDDLHLVGASPVSRRNYFDKVFSQLSEQYSTALYYYTKTVTQRNKLLKNEFVKLEDLFSWDVMLAKYGVILAEKRREMVQDINERFTEVYRSIAENEDEVKLLYESETYTESEFLARLTRDFQRDSLLGHTSFGVHHDNFTFIFNQVKADGSASRGEVRSSVLALKFIEAELVYRETKKKPLVLLDDVFSELDQARQRCLVRNFQDHQVVLTACDSEDGLRGKVVLGRE